MVGRIYLDMLRSGFNVRVEIYLILQFEIVNFLVGFWEENEGKISDFRELS